MVRPDQETLSAYIDGEVAPPFERAIAEAIANDSETEARYRSLLSLRASLPAVSEATIQASAVRSWGVIQSHLAYRPARRGRSVSIPLPGVALAATAVVALAAALIWSLFARPSISAERLLADQKDVDVTIQLADGDMEQVLSWLASQDMLGEVSIQLPEQQFSMVGEPVLLKSVSYPGDADR
jgi:hypothetical protein